MMVETAKNAGKLALIIPTKDRPAEIRRALDSLAGQVLKPDQVIVVDGGARSVEAEVMSFPELKPIYLRAEKPSAAGQRNLGLSAADEGCALVGFLDDDAVLEPSAVEKMLKFWESAPPGVGGAAFNLSNHPLLYASHLKRSRLAKHLGLYSDERGRVLRSGFQTMIGRVKEDIFVDWLTSGASVWRAPVFERFRFDEWYEGYSYLEDLDFSYQVGKEFRLAVVADARYCHLPASAGRGNGVKFGRREVRNRLHFVKKNPELSLGLCRLALGLRMAMSFLLFVRDGQRAHLGRVVGNCIELFRIS